MTTIEFVTFCRSVGRLERALKWTDCEENGYIDERADMALDASQSNPELRVLREALIAAGEALEASRQPDA